MEERYGRKSAPELQKKRQSVCVDMGKAETLLEEALFATETREAEDKLRKAKAKVAFIDQRLTAQATSAHLPATACIVSPRDTYQYLTHRARRSRAVGPRARAHAPRRLMSTPRPPSPRRAPPSRGGR